MDGRRGGLAAAARRTHGWEEARLPAAATRPHEARGTAHDHGGGRHGSACRRERRPHLLDQPLRRGGVRCPPLEHVAIAALRPPPLCSARLAPRIAAFSTAALLRLPRPIRSSSPRPLLHSHPALPPTTLSTLDLTQTAAFSSFGVSIARRPRVGPLLLRRGRSCVAAESSLLPRQV